MEWSESSEAGTRCMAVAECQGETEWFWRGFWWHGRCASHHRVAPENDARLSAVPEHLQVERDAYLIAHG